MFQVYMNHCFIFFPCDLQVLTSAWSQVCPRRCQCPKDPPLCHPGVPLVLDDCACCLVCARQRGQLCSEMNPCDTRKGLNCEYGADVHKRTGICVGKPGRARAKLFEHETQKKICS